MKDLRKQMTHTGLACSVVVAGATLGFTAAASKQAAAQPGCEYDICNAGNAVCFPSGQDYNCRIGSDNQCHHSQCTS